MMIIDGVSFTDQDVLLDGIQYKNCKFERCKIFFFGNLQTMLQENSFSECSWQFAGPAQTTVQFMTAMYQHGGGLRELVEAALLEIRGTTNAPPPSQAH